MSTDREALRRKAKLALEIGHECNSYGFVRCAMCEFKPDPQEILDILAERDTYRRFASSRAMLVREKRRLILAQRDHIAKLEAGQSVCHCFITKPCRDCLGSGRSIEMDDTRTECRVCKGTGRKREPKCDKCEAEGKP